MTTATYRDADIQQGVLEEFEWDPQVEPTEIGVQVDDGVVTLTGAVDVYSKKLAAERAARRVDGVRAVANDLSVKSLRTHNDTDIAKAAANALEANTIVPGGAVDVTVNNGKINLSGTVGWDFQRIAAADAVRRLPGVRDVVNAIAIRQPNVSAVEIKNGIERALVRAAEVDATRIQVHADGGHVRLAGIARTWAEKQAASLAAWNAKGVTAVTNEIKVRSL